MPDETSQDFLAVRWYDGLLVRSDHLVQADARVSALSSQLAKVVLDQAGLMHIDSDMTMGSQLVEVAGLRRQDDGSTRISLNILKPFRGVSPDGHIIIGLPNKKQTRGLPAPEVFGTIAQGQRTWTTW